MEEYWVSKQVSRLRSTLSRDAKIAGLVLRDEVLRKEGPLNGISHNCSSFK